MKTKFAAVFLLSAAAAGMTGIRTEAAFEASMEAAYNSAVQGQDMLEGLDVTVSERIVSSATNLASQKEMEIKVSGINSESLNAEIAVDTDEGSSETYYTGGWYYSETSEGKVKQEMDRSSIWNLVTSRTYLDLTSNYLKMLSSETAQDGTVTYRFSATSDTLGDYSKKFLEGAAVEQGLEIDSLHGEMTVDADGHVSDRTISLVYTVTKEDQEETFLLNSDVTFRKTGDAASVSLPDLSGYKVLAAEKPAETLTPLTQTVYATADVNVRAAGDLTSVILGGLYKGTGVMETGYTSDGWIQIQYNGAAGYVWGDYLSTTKPVITKDGSGTMYATADVNVRSTYSSSGSLLGTLSKGSSIEITGTTDNGWIRVKYNGGTGYIYADYLTRTVPVVSTYVENGYMSGIVTDASFGVLTIRRDDGAGTATFNTTYAQLNFRDTLETGDWVELYYSGAGAPYTASIVNDYTRHENADEEVSVSAEGVITELTPDVMKILDTDGIYRTIDISNCEFEGSEDLYEGKYVIVYWMSRTNGVETRDIEALRIKGD